MNSMTNCFFGMVTILWLVTIKMSRNWLWQKFEREICIRFEIDAVFFLIFDKVINSFPIVNCQIVNNCCYGKDLKVIFESDVICLEVSFSSLTMQTSSIYKLICKPVNMYIIVAMAKIWKEVFGRCKLLRAVFLIFDKETNSSPIVNCQIVNNCCYGKDLKEIFESDANRLEVSFSSLTMQSSSIERLNCK